MQAYSHLGLEYYLTDREAYPSPGLRPGEGGQVAGQILLQAHAFRLLGRLGAGASLKRSVRDESGQVHPSHRIEFWEAGWSEASLRLRFGPAEDGDGIQIGLMPLQGNPDAVLFGNYLARFAPYNPFETRALQKWDSLGCLSPQVEGARFALGRTGGPARGEAWLVREGEDLSWFAFLSGTAPRRMEWGVGLSGYRAWTWSKPLAAPGRDPGAIILDPSDTAHTDTISGSSMGTSFSAQVSLDFASLTGSEVPPGRYGGIFGEAALLGWEDRPFAKPRRSRRIVWTAGARIPTFGWLDVCVAQWEWRIFPGGEFSASEPSNAISPVPSENAPASTPGGPSHWNIGLLVSKRLGGHFEVQARALSEVQAWGGVYYGMLLSRASRQDRVLGRVVFRFR
jgi:hypothetical protein